jgi:hypothetical protein
MDINTKMNRREIVYDDVKFIYIAHVNGVESSVFITSQLVHISNLKLSGRKYKDYRHVTNFFRTLFYISRGRTCLLKFVCSFLPERIQIL